MTRWLANRKCAVTDKRNTKYQNYLHKEIKSKLNSGNVFQILFAFRILCKIIRSDKAKATIKCILTVAHPSPTRFLTVWFFDQAFQLLLTHHTWCIVRLSMTFFDNIINNWYEYTL